jgi:spore coat polysaccharide biosynthesis protein SpsF
VVATSREATDDELASILRRSSFAVFRGDLLNVRSRVLGAIADLNDDDVVVRLTADNPGPDGGLIQMVIDEFRLSNADHIETSGSGRLLPYGMSVEVFTAGGLRRSCGWRDSEEDREHVTPALRTLGKSVSSRIQYADKDLSAIRCTIDDFDDWTVMNTVFGTFENPFTARWTDVIDRLLLVQSKSRRSPQPRFIFGTAQLAQPYGSVSKVSPPIRSEAISMVRFAVANGAWIDTARAYGESERIIGEALRGWQPERTRIMTKCALPLGAKSETEMREGLRNSIRASLDALHISSLPVVLLHDPRLLTRYDGACVQLLQELQSCGDIQSFGVSVDGPGSLVSALQDPRIKVVQFAYNLLDERWHDPEALSAFASRPDVEFHCRSVFLQGIFLRPATAWPRIKGVVPAIVLASLDAAKRALSRDSMIDLCLSWVTGSNPLHQHLAGVVLGAESRVQLEELRRDFDRPSLSLEEVTVLREMVPNLPDELFNPALWPSQT